VTAKSPSPSALDERVLARRRERMAAVGALRLRNALWPGADDGVPRLAGPQLLVVPPELGSDVAERAMRVADASQGDDGGGAAVAPAQSQGRRPDELALRAVQDIA
jgi:hypothetical protein